MIQKVYLKEQQFQKKNYCNTSHKEALEHQSWCIKNDILIYFEPDDWRGGNIIINKKGEKIIMPGYYNQTKLKPNETRYHTVIWQLYTKFYNEENNKHIINQE